jgi:hypothetical protein
MSRYGLGDDTPNIEEQLLPSSPDATPPSGSTGQPAVTMLAQQVLNAVNSGQVSPTSTAINSAIKTAADIYSVVATARKRPVATPSFASRALSVVTPSSTNWVIPAAVVGGLLLVGYLVSRK